MCLNLKNTEIYKTS